MSYIATLFQLVGLVLALGSIATFIVLNAAVGSSADVALIHHQRVFVSAISRMLTVPGTAVLACAGVLRVAAESRPLANPWPVALLVLEVLVVMNTLFFIAPLVRDVTALARSGAEQGRMLPAYPSRKAREDRHGAANFLMLVAVLLLLTAVK